MPRNYLVTHASICTVRPVVPQYHARPVKQDVPSVAKLLHYVAMTLWAIPISVLVGWLFGWTEVAASEQHSIVVGSVLFYGLGLLIGWIGELARRGR